MNKIKKEENSCWSWNDFLKFRSPDAKKKRNKIKLQSKTAPGQTNIRKVKKTRLNNRIILKKTILSRIDKRTAIKDRHQNIRQGFRLGRWWGSRSRRWGPKEKIRHFSRVMGKVPAPSRLPQKSTSQTPLGFSFEGNEVDEWRFWQRI